MGQLGISVPLSCMSFTFVIRMSIYAILRTGGGQVPLIRVPLVENTFIKITINHQSENRQTGVLVE